MGWFSILLIGFIVFLIARSKRGPRQDDVPIIDRSPPSYVPHEREAHPRKDICIDDLKNWLMGSLSADRADVTDVVVFDTETNGKYAKDASVLSIAGIRLRWDSNGVLQESSRFERFYYPIEPFNEDAVRVNGLTKSRIATLRQNATYPNHFLADSGFEEFCKGVDLFAGHNIDFDASFVPFVQKKRLFDTMKSNMDIVCAEWNESRQAWKWPKLSETALYYGVSFKAERAHGAMYDAEVTTAVLKEMLRRAGIAIIF